MNRPVRYLMCILIALVFFGFRQMIFSDVTADHTMMPIMAMPRPATPSDSSNASGQPDENEHEPEYDEATYSDIPIPLTDALPEHNGIVHNETELLEWISLYNDVGGTVRLGNTITLTEYVSADTSVLIDTGPFGLVLDGGSMHHDIRITGEGVDVPVVDVIQAGSGAFWDLSFNNYLVPLHVTAEGRDGIGGIAMRILTADTKPFDLITLDAEPPGTIRSYGQGAVGLWLDVPMTAYCYQVEVSGEDAIAVYAPDGSDLYYCRLSADGQGARAAAGSDIQLDCCLASPEPTGTGYYRRTFLSEYINKLYLPIRQYEDQSLFDIAGFYNVSLPMSGNGIDEGDIVYRTFPVTWDEDSFFRIDTSQTGSVDISGHLSEMFMELGLNNLELTLTVEVRPSDLPCIYDVTVTENESGQHYTLLLWDTYDPDDGTIILWRSDDEGETWQDITWSETVVWDLYELTFTCQPSERPIWLVLELAGAGDSNIIALTEHGITAFENMGGDRTGTDRDGEDGDDSDGDDGSGNDGSGDDGSNDDGNGDGNNGNHNNNHEQPGNSMEQPGNNSEQSGDGSSDGDSSKPDADASNRTDVSTKSGIQDTPDHQLPADTGRLLPFPSPAVGEKYSAAIPSAEVISNQMPVNEIPAANSSVEAVSGDTAPVAAEPPAAPAQPQTVAATAAGETSGMISDTVDSDRIRPDTQDLNGSGSSVIILLLGVAAASFAILLFLRRIKGQSHE